MLYNEEKRKHHMSIGIDKIGFATSQYVLNMADLALARGE